MDLRSHTMVNPKKRREDMVSNYRVYYRRFENHKKGVVGYWENLKKDFNTEEEADLFINRIKQNIIVSWYVKSKIYSNT